MSRPPWGLALAAAALLSACTATPPAGPAQTTPPATSGPVTSSAAPDATTRTAPDGRPFVVEQKATFAQPWAMSFLPGGEQALVTERGGRLLLVNTATGSSTPVSGTPEVVAAGQGGLGDIVPGPTFTQDRTVYLSWAERGDGVRAAVGTARLSADGTTLTDLRVIWRQPGTSGNGHFGHRLAFSPDGRHLFVTSGDRQKMEPAQDLGTTLGTIVRLNLDGTPAADNPYADRGGMAAEIWTHGHRNPLGIAFDADGRLWSSEMGAQGGDELNLIERGGNYGWPRASNGSHYGGGDIPDHTDADGFVSPLAWWTPSISPGSLMIYSGDAFPDWRGNAFVGALSGESLVRVELAGATARVADTWPMGQRIREVEQGPDGAIWLLEDGSGARLLKLTTP